MKLLRSTEEGVWAESVSAGSTGIFNLFSPASRQEEKNKSKQKGKPDKEVSSSAQEIYERNKPVVTDSETYELISANILLGSFHYQGIINYRLNGVHQQLRIEGITGME